MLGSDVQAVRVQLYALAHLMQSHISKNKVYNDSIYMYIYDRSDPGFFLAGVNL